MELVLFFVLEFSRKADQRPSTSYIYHWSHAPSPLVLLDIFSDRVLPFCPGLSLACDPLTLNLDPPDLHLQNSWDYRYVPPC
jgi:hypothetical protein